jgi:hypothetical protein
MDSNFWQFFFGLLYFALFFGLLAFVFVEWR